MINKIIYFIAIVIIGIFVTNYIYNEFYAEMYYKNIKITKPNGYKITLLLENDKIYDKGIWLISINNDSNKNNKKMYLLENKNKNKITISFQPVKFNNKELNSLKQYNLNDYTMNSLRLSKVFCTTKICLGYLKYKKLNILYKYKDGLGYIFRIYMDSLVISINIKTKDINSMEILLNILDEINISMNLHPRG